MSYPHISLIHPTGNPNSRQAAIALSEIGLLQELITTISYNPNSKINRLFSLLPKKLENYIKQELGRRTWIPPKNVSLQTYPWIEIMRLAILRTGLNSQFGWTEQSLIDRVYLRLDHLVAKNHLQNLDAVYAYEDGAATTFQAAKQQGILCLYDLPILFYRTSRDIQSQEAQRFPELASALQATRESALKLERKEQEIQLADRIFVPSSFVQKSLLDAGIQSDKIRVIPFGAPVEYFQPQPKPDQLFRALFVGRVSPRKGVHYLLQAWQQLRLPNAELLLVGINDFPADWFKRYIENIRYLPSVPHSTLNQYYTTASVLILPSLVEGLPLVLLEAMACGIPIITTPNAGGCDLISDGIEGFIIPIRDVESLQAKIEWCYLHPQELAQMGQAARKRAERLNWGTYRQKLINCVKELVDC